MNPMIRIGCILLVLIAGSSTFAQTDWPRWGGRNADFITPDVGWSTRWPDGKLREVWSRRVGVGFSSLSVVDSLLYTMGRRNEQDVVSCLNTGTGEIVWEHKYDSKNFDSLHEGGSGATPTIHDDAVFTFSREGILFCLDRMTGDVRWQKNASELAEVKPGEWGLTASPLIIGDKVVVEVGRLVAFDIATGELVWKTETEYRPGYGTPSILQRDGRQLIAALNNDVLQLVAVDNGSEIASFKWKTQYATSAATPLIFEDTIFLSTGYGAGCVLLRFDGSDLAEVYRNKKLANHMNPSVLLDGALYGIHGNSHNARVCKVVCMDHETGRVVWEHREFGCGSLIVAGDRLLILSDDGKLVCAAANREGFKEFSRAKILDGRCWTNPVLVGNRVFARNSAGKLVCAELP